ncbi:phage baseplate assembly protein V [Silvanigrella sp.]|jgi:phage baseplate assembly protein V|uniref:phage baseplate assembly protein V n=1 Tax=Silvanigrella sp. TaxID=2024976 RepID=UPI0037C5CB65
MSNFNEIIYQKFHNFISTSTLKIVNDKTKTQTCQLELFSGEIKEKVERWQQYGITSVPLPETEALCIAAGGERDRVYIVATEDKDYRPISLKSGEVALYTNEKDKLHFQNGNKVLLETHFYTAKVKEKIQDETKLFELKATDSIKNETKAYELKSSDNINQETKAFKLNASESINQETKSFTLKAANSSLIDTKSFELKASTSVKIDTQTTEIKTNKFKVQGSSGELISIISELVQAVNQFASLVGNATTPPCSLWYSST